MPLICIYQYCSINVGVTAPTFMPITSEKTMLTHLPAATRERIFATIKRAELLIEQKCTPVPIVPAEPNTEWVDYQLYFR